MDIAGNGGNVLVGQLGGNAAHNHRIAIVDALAFTKIGQLLGGVLCVLATQMRKARCAVASALRGMAAGAGGHAFGQFATAKQAFTAMSAKSCSLKLSS